MAEIVYRQMPAPRDIPQKMPAPRAKIRMQKPQSGGEFSVQIPGGARGGMVMAKIDNCITDCVKSFHNFGVQITEIWQIVSFFIMKWSTMTSRILLFSILWWHWGKRYFRFLSEIWTLELHIPRTAWRIFSWWYMYHSFSILTVLSSKRNLYFACSSVLRFALHSVCGGHGFESEWNLQMNLAKVSWCKENACLQLCLKRLAKSVPNMQCKKITQTGKI